MSYNFHRPKYFKKKALVITTTAGAGEKSTANYIKEVLNCWGIDSVYTLALKYRDDILNKNNSEIDKVVEPFITDLYSREYKSPSFKSLLIYNVWRGMSKNAFDEGDADYNYWKSTNLCNYVYHPDIKIGYIKNIYSNIIYKLISKKIK